jgi:hypothetical protein
MQKGWHPIVYVDMSDILLAAGYNLLLTVWQVPISVCSINFCTSRQPVKESASVMAPADFSETQHIIVNTTNSGAQKRSRYTNSDILKKMRLSTNETGPHLLHT